MGSDCLSLWKLFTLDLLLLYGNEQVYTFPRRAGLSEGSPRANCWSSLVNGVLMKPWERTGANGLFLDISEIINKFTPSSFPLLLY